MKICIFSDVHGNLEALEKMFEAEGDAECFIFAGDIVGYFYEQKRIIECFQRTKNLLAVKGNHDYNFLDKEQDKKELVEQYGSSYSVKLSKEQMEYIRKMPEWMEIEIAGKRFGIFHGGIEDYMNQRVYPDSKIDIDLYQQKYDYIILGHTHYRLFRKEKDTLVINPGSLGQPRDGDGFSYCILNTDNDSCEYKNVKVDIQKLLQEVDKYDSGREVCRYLHEKYGGVK